MMMLSVYYVHAFPRLCTLMGDRLHYETVAVTEWNGSLKAPKLDDAVAQKRRIREVL